MLNLWVDVFAPSCIFQQYGCKHLLNRVVQCVNGRIQHRRYENIRVEIFWYDATGRVQFEQHQPVVGRRLALMLLYTWMSLTICVSSACVASTEQLPSSRKVLSSRESAMCKMAPSRSVVAYPKRLPIVVSRKSFLDSPDVIKQRSPYECARIRNGFPA